MADHNLGPIEQDVPFALDIAVIPLAAHTLAGLGHPWEPEHRQGTNPKQPRPVDLRPPKPWPAG